MKTFRQPICILISLVAIYLIGYYVYYHTNFGILPASRLGRAIGSFFAPCDKVEETWRTNQQRKMDKMQFIGEWEDPDGKMSIKKNGQFMLKFCAQTIRGNGKFEEIDDTLFFILEAKCQLEKYKEPDSRPQLISDYQYDSNYYVKYDEICRIQIHIFQADNPDKFQLAAGVIISNLKETEGYHSSHMFGKVSP